MTRKPFGEQMIFNQDIRNILPKEAVIEIPATENSEYVILPSKVKKPKSAFDAKIILEREQQGIQEAKKTIGNYQKTQRDKLNDRLFFSPKYVFHGLFQENHITLFNDYGRLFNDKLPSNNSKVIQEGNQSTSRDKPNELEEEISSETFFGYQLSFYEYLTPLVIEKVMFSDDLELLVILFETKIVVYEVKVLLDSIKAATNLSSINTTNQKINNSNQINTFVNSLNPNNQQQDKVLIPEKLVVNTEALSAICQVCSNIYILCFVNNKGQCRVCSFQVAENPQVNSNNNSNIISNNNNNQADKYTMLVDFDQHSERQPNHSNNTQTSKLLLEDFCNEIGYRFKKITSIGETILLEMSCVRNSLCLEQNPLLKNTNDDNINKIQSKQSALNNGKTTQPITSFNSDLLVFLRQSLLEDSILNEAYENTNTSSKNTSNSVFNTSTNPLKCSYNEDSIINNIVVLSLNAFHSALTGGEDYNTYSLCFSRFSYCVFNDLVMLVIYKHSSSESLENNIPSLKTPDYKGLLANKSTLSSSDSGEFSMKKHLAYEEALIKANLSDFQIQDLLFIQLSQSAIAQGEVFIVNNNNQSDSVMLMQKQAIKKLLTSVSFYPGVFYYPGEHEFQDLAGYSASCLFNEGLLILAKNQDSKCEYLSIRQEATMEGSESEYNESALVEDSSKQRFYYVIEKRIFEESKAVFLPEEQSAFLGSSSEHSGVSQFSLISGLSTMPFQFPGRTLLNRVFLNKTQECFSSEMILILASDYRMCFFDLINLDSEVIKLLEAKFESINEGTGKVLLNELSGGCRDKPNEKDKDKEREEIKNTQPSGLIKDNLPTVKSSDDNKANPVKLDASSSTLIIANNEQKKNTGLVNNNNQSASSDKDSNPPECVVNNTKSALNEINKPLEDRSKVKANNSSVPSSNIENNNNSKLNTSISAPITKEEAQKVNTITNSTQETKLQGIQDQQEKKGQSAFIAADNKLQNQVDPKANINKDPKSLEQLSKVNKAIESKSEDVNNIANDNPSQSALLKDNSKVTNPFQLETGKQQNQNASSQLEDSQNQIKTLEKLSSDFQKENAWMINKVNDLNNQLKSFQLISAEREKENTSLKEKLSNLESEKLLTQRAKEVEKAKRVSALKPETNQSISIYRQDYLPGFYQLYKEVFSQSAEGVYAHKSLAGFLKAFSEEVRKKFNVSASLLNSMGVSIERAFESFSVSKQQDRMLCCVSAVIDPSNQSKGQSQSRSTFSPDNNSESTLLMKLTSELRATKSSCIGSLQFEKLAECVSSALNSITAKAFESQGKISNTTTNTSSSRVPSTRDRTVSLTCGYHVTINRLFSMKSTFEDFCRLFEFIPDRKLGSKCFPSSSAEALKFKGKPVAVNKTALEEFMRAHPEMKSLRELVNSSIPLLDRKLQALDITLRDEQESKVLFELFSSLASKLAEYSRNQSIYEKLESTEYFKKIQATADHRIDSKLNKSRISGIPMDKDERNRLITIINNDDNKNSEEKPVDGGKSKSALEAVNHKALEEEYKAPSGEGEMLLGSNPKNNSNNSNKSDGNLNVVSKQKTEEESNLGDKNLSKQSTNKACSKCGRMHSAYFACQSIYLGKFGEVNNSSITGNNISSKTCGNNNNTNNSQANAVARSAFTEENNPKGTFNSDNNLNTNTINTHLESTPQAESSKQKNINNADSALKPESNKNAFDLGKSTFVFPSFVSKDKDEYIPISSITKKTLSNNNNNNITSSPSKALEETDLDQLKPQEKHFLSNIQSTISKHQSNNNNKSTLGAENNQQQQPQKSGFLSEAFSDFIAKILDFLNNLSISALKELTKTEALKEKLDGSNSKSTLTTGFSVDLTNLHGLLKEKRGVPSTQYSDIPGIKSTFAPKFFDTRSFYEKLKDDIKGSEPVLTVVKSDVNLAQVNNNKSYTKRHTMRDYLLSKLGGQKHSQGKPDGPGGFSEEGKALLAERIGGLKDKKSNTTTDNDFSNTVSFDKIESIVPNSSTDKTTILMKGPKGNNDKSPFAVKPDKAQIKKPFSSNSEKTRRDFSIEALPQESAFQDGLGGLYAFLEKEKVIKHSLPNDYTKVLESQKNRKTKFSEKESKVRNTLILLKEKESKVVKEGKSLDEIKNYLDNDKKRFVDDLIKQGRLNGPQAPGLLNQLNQPNNAGSNSSNIPQSTSNPRQNTLGSDNSTLVDTQGRTSSKLDGKQSSVVNTMTTGNNDSRTRQALNTSVQGGEAQVVDPSFAVFGNLGMTGGASNVPRDLPASNSTNNISSRQVVFNPFGIQAVNPEQSKSSTIDGNNNNNNNDKHSQDNNNIIIITTNVVPSSNENTNQSASAFQEGTNTPLLNDFKKINSNLTVHQLTPDVKAPLNNDTNQVNPEGTQTESTFPGKKNENNQKNDDRKGSVLSFRPDCGKGVIVNTNDQAKDNNNNNNASQIKNNLLHQGGKGSKGSGTTMPEFMTLFSKTTNEDNNKSFPFNNQINQNNDKALQGPSNSILNSNTTSGFPSFGSQPFNSNLGTGFPTSTSNAISTNNAFNTTGFGETSKLTSLFGANQVPNKPIQLGGFGQSTLSSVGGGSSPFGNLGGGTFMQNNNQGGFQQNSSNNSQSPFGNIASQGSNIGFNNTQNTGGFFGTNNSQQGNNSINNVFANNNNNNNNTNTNNTNNNNNSYNNTGNSFFNKQVADFDFFKN